MSAVRLTLHLASVWSWLTAVVGLVWVRSNLSGDVAREFGRLADRLRVLALLGAVGLFATGMWSAAVSGAALESDRYGAVLLTKGAAFSVSGSALVVHQQADRSGKRPMTGILAITSATAAIFLGVLLRT